ncbi:hypothetical protein V7054_05080 [Priestia megaterium]|uniref:hypothetical protein n=1 Tax=Priestia megaterium TaxID=1404 RepID=UPI002FFFE66E
MNITYKQYEEMIDYLEKIYNQYVGLKVENCDAMLIHHDESTQVYGTCDGSLTVSHLIEHTDDGLTLVAYMYNTPDGLEFEINVKKVDA